MLTDTMTERQILETIRQACSLFGWLCYHTYDSRRSEPGFPDLIIVGYGAMLLLELKSARGYISKEQRAWLAELADVTQPPIVRLVRPKDLDDILAILQDKGHGGLDLPES
jgi:hypothetical protein